MNKPTREQIEHRAMDILSNEFPHITKLVLKKAEIELTTKLSDIDRYELKVMLNNLKKATGHDYTHIEKIMKPVKHTRFYLKERLGVKGEFDTVCGTYLCLLELEPNNKYSIEDLLNG